MLSRCLQCVTLKTGYVLCTEVYTGKGQQNKSIIGLFQRILSGYFDKRHTFFMDRFYSSAAVFDFLWARKTKAVGTVHACQIKKNCQDKTLWQKN